MKDQLERKHGSAHVLFSWRGDWRWPERLNGAVSQRTKVAEYTWARLAGRGHALVIAASDGWSKPVVPFYVDECLESDLCVVRVDLRRQLSQFVGWLPLEEFAEIEPVNWSFDRDRPRYRRVVLEWMLKRGWPRCIVGHEDQRQTDPWEEL